MSKCYLDCPQCGSFIQIEGGFIPETFICIACRTEITAKEFFENFDKQNKEGEE